MTVDGNGDWTIVIPATDLPSGEYDLPVSATVTTEGGTITHTGTLDVDTLAEVTFSADTVETDGTVNFVEESDGVVLTGTTQAGSTVVVTFGGSSYNAVVTGETWTLNLPAGTLPTGDLGTSVDITVTATDNHGNTATVTDTLEIDTITGVTITPIAAGGDNTVNAAERTAGLTITGTAEAGATVVVTMAGYAHTVTANASGQWTTTYASTEISRSEFKVENVTAVATDAAGNTASAAATVKIDTEIGVTITPIAAGGDNTVNAVERDAGLVVNGTSEAGATVVVTMAGFSHTVTANSAGQWTTTYSKTEISRSEGKVETVTAVASDAAGNTATTSATVKVDTEIAVTVDTSDVDGPDAIVNFEERKDGIVLHGTADAGSTVVVTFNGYTHTVTATSAGTWSSNYAVGELPIGNVENNYAVTVKATDTAGNTATTTGTVKLDTWVNNLTHPGLVETDDVVNKAEASDGITLTGKVEAGSSVVVDFNGLAHTATVTGTTWTVTYTGAEIPQGTYDAAITITATDAAGNVRSITDTFVVDTDVPDAPGMEGIGLYDNGVRDIAIDNTDDSITVHSYNSGSAGTTLIADNGDRYLNGRTGELEFGFDNPVVDGKQLIVTATDDHGNTNSTLLVLDERSTNVVDVTATGIDGFNVGAIDLTFADKSTLSLTKANIDDLSANDNVLVVHGALDDAVTFQGTATMTGTEVIGGETYNVYSVGGDSVLKIDDDIQFSTTI